MTYVSDGNTAKGITAVTPENPIFTLRAMSFRCPKHGEHGNYIESTIPGHEGYWCQICWIESLGPPMERIS